MSGWKPGTVAKATVRGVPDVTVMAGYGTAEPRLRWMTTDARLVDARNDGWYMAYDVTDVRPLVVLDLDNYSGERAVNYLRNLASESRDVTGNTPSPRGKLALRIADQIEAQTKPPKPPEPTGLGAVVEDNDGRRWVRIEGDPGLNKPWRLADMAAIRSHWQNVKAARVLSEGVEA